MGCECRSPALLALLPFFGLTLAGCGGGPKYVDVEGTVTLNGKPFDDAQVQFLPDPVHGAKGLRSTGRTDANGQFKLKTDKGDSGAVVGNHRVLVQDLKQWEGINPGREDMNKPLKPSRLPNKYINASETPLKVEVKAGGGPVKLELTSK